MLLGLMGYLGEGREILGGVAVMGVMEELWGEGGLVLMSGSLKGIL